MSSGITVDEQCVKDFEEMKLRKSCAYIIYRISDDLKRIEIDCKGNPGSTFDEFKELMVCAADQGMGRYAVLDYNKTLVFVSWIEDDKVKVKQRMLYSSSKKALKDKLNGIMHEMQCNDVCDLSESVFADKVAKKI